MSKGLAGVILSGGALRPDTATPLYAQLYQAMRAAILSGDLAAGTRLPSTRTLARDLGVSRNTVLSAFARLMDEGYLRAGVGDGTYVAELAPERLRAIGAAPRRVRGTAEISVSQNDNLLRLSRRCERERTTAQSLRASLHRQPWQTLGQQESRQQESRQQESGQQELRQPTSRELVAFEDGIPALDVFPFELWGRLLARRWKASGPQLLDYAAPDGFAPLREAIATYLASARGVRCEASQVIITSGSQGALTLAARVLLNEGDAVWIEDPGYLGARGAFQSAGAHLVPVPLDDEGLDLPTARSQPAAFPLPRVTFVTPSHQFPLGMTMSLARRLALLEWAEKNAVWIIEDDYDSEFRYAGRPLPALQGLDSASRVLYSGTFSKVLFPALRLGYLVVPPTLVEAFSIARSLSDLHSPLLEQAVVTDFMRQGHFSRHLRRMRALYAARQSALLEAAQQHLAGKLRLESQSSGMSLIGWLPAESNEREIARLAIQSGVRVQPLSQYSLHYAHPPALLLGYTAFDAVQLEEGTKRLAESLRTSSKWDDSPRTRC